MSYSYRSQFDDDVHGAAYDRATACTVFPIGTESVHHWDDDRAFYCPQPECPCHKGNDRE